MDHNQEEHQEERFTAEMEAIVPWKPLIAPIEPLLPQDQP
jgi:hypothetical protein